MSGRVRRAAREVDAAAFEFDEGLRNPGSVLRQPSDASRRAGDSAVRGWLGRVGERGGEKAVGPVLGVAAGVGEDELDVGIADLEASELVGEPATIDVLELE